jgi:serine/threonine-protein kinase
LARDVALKTLKDNVSAFAKDALLREARVTGALDHPGVIPVHALGLDEHGQPLLVMKRVEGVEWRTLLEEPDHALWSARGAHGLEGNLEILMRVCETVEFSHSRGMLHLDIKPGT